MPPPLRFFKLNSCENSGGVRKQVLDPGLQVPSVTCPANHVIKDEMGLEHVDVEVRDVHKQPASSAVKVDNIRLLVWYLRRVYCRVLSILSLGWEAIQGWP